MSTSNVAFISQFSRKMKPNASSSNLEINLMQVVI